MAVAAATSANLAAVYGVTETVEVGNPLPSAATIDLKVRRLGMPADWAVSVSPDTLTLGAGEHKPVKVTISPASASAQGTAPGVAVEGYANGELLGGVEVRVVVPTYAQLRARVLLPLVLR
jgi:hypothetical protein